MVLTLRHLSLLADVPGVQGCALLRLHGGPLVEVLGQVGLVEAGGVHHLPLRDVVLLQVGLDHLRHAPRVLPGQGAGTGLLGRCSRALRPGPRARASPERGAAGESGHGPAQGPGGRGTAPDRHTESADADAPRKLGKQGGEGPHLCASIKAPPTSYLEVLNVSSPPPEMGATLGQQWSGSQRPKWARHRLCR